MNFIQGINQSAKLSYPKTTFIISLIGLVIVLKKIFRILKCLYGLVRRRRNLVKRYGPKSWAFITGSSDGIGKALALSLAKSGFNIILSARTQSKLEKVRQEIRQKYPQVQVQIVQADYKKAHDEEYLQNILSPILNLNISIVINNVGVDVLNYYHQLPPKQIADLIKINCFPVSLINRVFIPILLERKKKTGHRAAIVNVASIAGMIPMPLHNIYSASKAYVDRLSMALQYQYPQLDIVSLRPSEVSTPMTFNKETDIFTITAEQCAQGFLDNLGYENMTYGHWRHKLQGWLYDNVPQGFFNYIFLNYVGPDFMNDRRKAMKKQ